MTKYRLDCKRDHDEPWWTLHETDDYENVWSAYYAYNEREDVYALRVRQGNRTIKPMKVYG